MQKHGIHESWRDILPKISTYDHEKAHRYFSRKRLSGTGSWFIEHVFFRTWLDESNACFLWCSGNVGSGKTTITTAVIDAAISKSRKNGCLLSYFYCESVPRHEDRAMCLFESFLKQGLMYLAITHNKCPDSVSIQIRELYRYGGPERDPEDVVDIFSRFFKHFRTAVYVIDGLDELKDSERLRVVDTFRHLFTKSKEQKLFISSRTQPHHNINMIHIIPNTKYIHVDQEKLEDIKYYIERKIAEKRRIARELTNDPVLIEDIKSRLLLGAKGMFLWVQLQIEALWDLCHTDNEIKNALDNLPKDLRSTYNRCLQRIQHNNNTDHARKVFRWVGCASRSLHIEELKEAVAFTLEDRKWETGRVQSSRLVIERCANLVILDEYDQHVRFVHPSVQQYLFESRDHTHEFQFDHDRGQMDCGEFSINYLSFSDFGLQLWKTTSQPIALPTDIARPVISSTYGLGKMTKKLGSLVLSRSTLGSTRTLPARYHYSPVTSVTSDLDAAKFKFFSYATENWAIDNKFITKKSQMWPKFMALATQPNNSWKLHPWQSGGLSYYSHLHGLLGWAVRNQHMPLLELLIDFPHECDLRELCNKPLIQDAFPAIHVASRLGYIDVVVLLLGFCGVNDLDSQQRTALHYAAEKGHVKVVEILSRVKSAKLNVADKVLRKTPLLLSAEQGHTEVVRFLLNMKAKVEVRDHPGGTALYRAAENGHAEITRMLIAGGAKTETVDNEGITALCRAAENGHELVTKMLLEFGAEARIADKHGITPLHRAAEKGHEAVVKSLLAAEADVEAVDKDGFTPLYRAAENGHKAVVRALITNEVHAKISNEIQNSAFIRAAQNGHEGVVIEFIAGGATSNKILRRAAVNGHTAAVELLLTGRSKMDPSLWQEAKRGQGAIIVLLMERFNISNLKDDLTLKADLHWKDDFYPDLLSCAAENGFEDIIELLVMQKTVILDWNAKFNDRTPLCCAAKNGHEKVVEILLMLSEIDLNSENEPDGRTPLSFAAENGHENVVKLLLMRKDIGVNVKNSYHYRSPLSYAAANGHENVVKLLLMRKDIDVNSKNPFRHQSPLSYAAENGHENVVELLAKRNDIDVNSNSVPSSRTALSYAAGNGHEHVVKLLMQNKNVFVDWKSFNGQSPFFYAVENGHTKMVKLLLKRNDVNVNSKDHTRTTPLISAAKNVYEQIVQLLVKHNNIDLNSQDIDGFTPLLHAVKNRHEEAAQILLEQHDIDVNLRNRAGISPLFLAVEHGHEKTVKSLLERNDVNVNVRNKDETTPLMEATLNTRVNMIQLLVGHENIQTELKDRHGETALSYAHDNGHEALIEILERYPH